MEHERTANPALRVARITGGGVLIVGGVAGLVLPIVPGWLLIIPGLSLWSTEFRWAARLRRRAQTQLRRRRHPDRIPSDG